MHERSIIRTLLAQVDEIASAHAGEHAREIRVQIGPLSGVEGALLLSAFDQLRDEGVHEIARLRVDETPLAARCNECRCEFEPHKFRFQCPHCGSGDTIVVRGDGVVLESVVLSPRGPGAVV